MKALLIYPPQAQPFLPGLAIPSLSAFIRKNSLHEISIKDVNIMCYEYFLSEHFLSDKSSGFIEEINEAKDILRSGMDYYEPSKYYRAVSKINSALNEICLKYEGTFLDLKNFRMQYFTSSSDQILKAIKDYKRNPYLEFFDKFIIPSIIHENSGFIGISVSWASQIIPAFSLARMIKSARPDIHVSIGGSMITHLKDLLIHKRKLFAICNSFVAFEGEIPLLAMLNSIEKGRSIESVPGIIYPEGRKSVGCNEPQILKNMNEIPTPDFSGFKLKDYYSPKSYVPISGSRGCYWHKCAFCAHSFSLSAFRPRSPELICNDMKEINKTQSVNHFYFVDDALPISTLKRLPSIIEKSALNVYWGAEMRFDKAALNVDFSIAHRAGCRFLLFGLESKCQRILDLMNKGIDSKIVTEILNKSHNSGIINWLFLFLGFPGETEEESLSTMEFVLNNRSAIDMIAPGHFILSKNSVIYRNPLDYGIEKIEPVTMDYDLLLTFKYLAKNSQKPSEVKEILDSYKRKPEFSKFLREFVAEAHLMFFEKSHF